MTSRFTQDAYKLAFFHFLLSKGNVPVITPEANTLLVKEQLDENDDFLPKLQQYFVITKDQNDETFVCFYEYDFESLYDPLGTFGEIERITLLSV